MNPARRRRVTLYSAATLIVIHTGATLAQYCTQYEVAQLDWDPADSAIGEEEASFSIDVGIMDPWYASAANGLDASEFFANSGAIYMNYRESNGNLVLRQLLRPWDAAGGEFMGINLDMSGDFIIAGAPGDDMMCPGGEAEFGCGSAYVFRRDDGSTPLDLTDDLWVPSAKLFGTSPQEMKQFGNGVSIQGDWIAITEVSANCVSGPTSGAAFIFHRDDNGTPNDPTDDTWPLHAELTSPGLAGNPEDYFGRSVAIWENRVVVGAAACGLSLDPAADPGAAYVFRRDDPGTPEDVSDDVWNLEARLIAITFQGHRLYGGSVDIEDDLIVVGMEGDSTFGTWAGSAYVYRLNDRGTPDPTDDVWYLETRLSNGETPDALGVDVAISNGRILAGARDHVSDSVRTGAGFVFRQTGGTWRKEYYLLASDLVGPPRGGLGAKVDLDGDRTILSQHFLYEAWGVPQRAYVHHVQADCNGNCIPDEDEIASGAADCNGNGVPDDCDADCQPNGIVDECEITGGSALDVNVNLVPDECEDCNSNGTVDSFDIAAGTSFDCNYNNIPAECETECNARGVCTATGCVCNSNFTGPGCEFCAPDHYHYPLCVYCDADVTCSGNGTCYFLTGDCVCDPEWAGPNCNLAPCVTDDDCNDADPCTHDACTAPDCSNTPRPYGDVNNDNETDVFDILCVLDGFAENYATCPLSAVDIIPCTPDGIVDIFDILGVLDAFAGTIPCCDIP